jgi:hypothetical protein
MKPRENTKSEERHKWKDARVEMAALARLQSRDGPPWPEKDRAGLAGLC